MPTPLVGNALLSGIPDGRLGIIRWSA
jgi:hypothetical protein